MAKAETPKTGLKRADQTKSKQRFSLYLRGERVYLRKWPRLRGTAKSELQQAWIDRFGCVACLMKYGDPRTFERARELAVESGWYWRDIMEAGTYGKLIRFQDAERLTTPTCSVQRPTGQAYVNTVAAPVTFTVENWDTNVFWRTAEPTRLTVRTPGLYMVTFNIEWPDARNNYRRAWWRLNGDNAITFGQVGQQSGSTVAIRQASVFLWYFNANDYIELMAQMFGTNEQLTVQQGCIVAITPETII